LEDPSRNKSEERRRKEFTDPSRKFQDPSRNKSEERRRNESKEGRRKEFTDPSRKKTRITANRVIKIIAS
jgi:hypothetical protein